jgi:hypothetical protein
VKLPLPPGVYPFAVNYYYYYYYYYRTMAICGGSEVNSHAFLNFIPDEVRDRLYVSVALAGEYG